MRQKSKQNKTSHFFRLIRITGILPGIVIILVLKPFSAAAFNLGHEL